MDICFQSYQENTALTKQGLDQLQQLSQQLEQDMKKTEENRNQLLNMTHSKYKVDLPDIGDMVLMREEIELLTRHIAVMRARFAKFPPPEQLSKVETVDYSVADWTINGSQMNGTYENQAATRPEEVESEPVYEDVQTKEESAKPAPASRQSSQDTKTIETLEPLSKEDADQAVALLETMKQGQKLTSEEGRELLQNLAVDEKSYGQSSKKSSSKSKPDKLAILREDLAKNKGKSTRLTPEDLALIQYYLLNGKYKTRTLKQIRQGNTKNRISL